MGYAGSFSRATIVAMATRRPGSGLTERQREILALVARGRTNGQIADELGIGFETVKMHVSRILAELGVSSREEAAVWWWAEHGTGSRLRRLLSAGMVLKLAAGGAAGVGVAALAVVAIVASSDGGQPVEPDTAMTTRSPTVASATATATATPRNPAAAVLGPGAHPSVSPPPTAAASTTIPPDLKPEAQSLLLGAGVPLERVTWIERDLTLEGYTVELIGVYADYGRTVVLASAVAADPDSPDLLTSARLTTSYATGADNNDLGPAPTIGSGTSPTDRSKSWTLFTFGPFASQTDALGATFRFNELAGPNQQYRWANWSFTADVVVWPDGASNPIFPSTLANNGTRYTIESMQVSGLEVELEWAAEGDLADELAALPSSAADATTSIERKSEILEQLAPSVLQDGSQVQSGSSIASFGPGGRYQSFVIVPSPGDYELVFGDPGTSTARFSFPVP